MPGVRLTRRCLFVCAALILSLCGVSRSARAQGAPCVAALPPTVFTPVTGSLGDILIDDACEYVYATNTSQNRIEVFSLLTRTLQTPIQVGSQPAGFDITPDGRYMYVANSGGNNLSVVDLVQRVELRKITVPPPQFFNDTPYSIAIASNGLALFSTTFSGSGFGARMMQLNLATDQITARTDFYSSGRTTEATQLSASGDRSVIGIVAGDISSGPVFRYSAATNTFSPEKQLSAFISDVSLDYTGSKVLVMPGGYVLDAALSLSGTVSLQSGPGGGSPGGGAVDPSGATGYRAVASRIDVMNLSTFLKTGELSLGDTVGQTFYWASGRMDISGDSRLLAVITDHGFSVVRTMVSGIALSGNLDFGSVPAGGRATRTLTITNPGTAPLHVSSLSLPSGFTASFTPATMAPGGSQQVGVTFAPTKSGRHDGLITANGNQMTGGDVIAVSGFASTDTTRLGDFDRDTATDITIFRPSAGQWFILKSGTRFGVGAMYALGTSDDIPVPGDYDGDNKTDIAVYRPASGQWLILTSASNYTTTNTYQWGTTGDVPVAGDFDADGRSDIGIYRPATGGWYALLSSTGFTGGLGYIWGAPGDVPVPGDYDGDGQTDIAVYRPSTAHWFILKSSANYGAWATYQWGATGDVPVAGDYDGDGRRDIAIYRPSTGGWYVLLSSTGFAGGVGYIWGAGGDRPVPGDYDGDGRTDIAVYRESSGHWFILLSSSGYGAARTYEWGGPGDLPIVGQR